MRCGERLRSVTPAAPAAFVRSRFSVAARQLSAVAELSVVRSMRLSLPWKLIVLHSALIVLFMFTLWKRWFITDIPFDSFYAPFFFTSGPLVYFVAHFLQLWSEHLLPADASVFLPWDVIPGVVCLILGGIQWWCIGRLWLWFRTRRLGHASPHGTQEV